ncbi:hypothetical protein [Leeia sp.]|uniref:hypothetical protein n=1 Tax=Leeia sp. TaxID=2884678 RepID=UPI0035AE68CE
MRNFIIAIILAVPLAAMAATKPVSLRSLTPEQEEVVQDLLKAFRHMALCASIYYTALDSATLPSMSEDQQKELLIRATNNRLTCEKPAFEEMGKIERRAKSVGLE